MRVVLIHPPGSNWIAGGRDVSNLANRMAPLGLLALTAYLRRAGHTVHVLDGLGPCAPAGTEALARAALEQRPDLVGFSATTAGFLDACAIARVIKRRQPQVMTVCGGVHVSALGAALLADFPEIDVLCMGEGELTLAELCDGRGLEQIHGLIWRQSGQAIVNPARAQLAELDSLPFPAYEALAGFPSHYHLPLFSYIQAPGATLVTSRGCPYRCSYCDRSVFRRSYRSHSAEYVYEHLRLLRQRFGVRHVNIYDDLFTLDRQRVERICRLLIDRPLGVRLNCAVRVGHCDDALLRLLRQAGFLMLSLGIETGDADQLRRHKPGASLEAVRDTVRRIQAAGLRAKGLFIMGLPGETETSSARTTEFCLSLDLDDMNLAKFTPFPGAPLWPEVASSPSLDNDWRKMNCLNFVYLPEGIASFQRLEELYKQHVKRFYTSRAWRRRLRRRLWEHRHSLLRLLRDLPSFVAARRAFEPRGAPPEHMPD